MILVCQSYSTGDDTRDAELRKCREINEGFGVFERCDYLDGGDKRLTFGDMFQHCESLYRGQWCVFANSDIAFGSIAYALVGMTSEGLLVALTRWEDDSSPCCLGHVANGRFYSGSQDAWAFTAGGLPDITATHKIPMGLVGSDSAIAGWATTSGVVVVDPALTVKTRHIHAGVERPDRLAGSGCYFAYPRLTTLATTGEVLCHHWPRKDGEWEFEWELVCNRP